MFKRLLGSIIFILILLYASCAFINKAGSLELRPGDISVLNEDVDNNPLNGIATSLKDRFVQGMDNAPTTAASDLDQIYNKNMSILSWVKNIFHKKETPSTVAEGEMKVSYIDVGQGNATLVTTKGHAMLIDAGDNAKGNLILDYMKKEDVTSLDYFIISHPDSDHIGGADTIIESQIPIGQVMMPDYTKDTISYNEVIDSIHNLNITLNHPECDSTYSLGDAEFTIIGPCEKAESANDNSIALKLTHGKKSFVFTGDAEKEEYSILKNASIDLECDVLLCGHHGSATASSHEFLSATNPTWAVISVGAGNKYGHPHNETLARLEDEDAQIYRTDMSGTIICISDGKNLSWKFSK